MFCRRFRVSSNGASNKAVFTFAESAPAWRSARNCLTRGANALPIAIRGLASVDRVMGSIGIAYRHVRPVYYQNLLHSTSARRRSTKVQAHSETAITVQPRHPGVQKRGAERPSIHSAFLDVREADFEVLDLERHERAFPWRFDRATVGASSQWTHRWRETDSNLRSPCRGRHFSRP